MLAEPATNDLLFVCMSVVTVCLRPVQLTAGPAHPDAIAPPVRSLTVTWTDVKNASAGQLTTNVNRTAWPCLMTVPGLTTLMYIRSGGELFVTAASAGTAVATRTPPATAAPMLAATLLFMLFLRLGFTERM